MPQYCHYNAGHSNAAVANSVTGLFVQHMSHHTGEIAVLAFNRLKAPASPGTTHQTTATAAIDATPDDDKTIPAISTPLSSCRPRPHSGTGVPWLLSHWLITKSCILFTLWQTGTRSPGLRGPWEQDPSAEDSPDMSGARLTDVRQLVLQYPVGIQLLPIHVVCG